MKKAPFTPGEVTSLNGYQDAGVMHPFTCGSGQRCEPTHDAQGGTLTATIAGWVCPYCDYTQDWAHEWMADGSWRKVGEERDNWWKSQLGVEQISEKMVRAYLDSEREGEEVFGKMQSAMTDVLRELRPYLREEFAEHWLPILPEQPL